MWKALEAAVQHGEVQALVTLAVKYERGENVARDFVKSNELYCKAPDVQPRLTDLVIDVAPTSRDEFTAFIRSEIGRRAQVVKDADIPPQ